MVCDCYRCNDEAVCNNHTYGVLCDSELGQHIHAMYMCDNRENCYGGEDEEMCEEEDVVRQCVPGNSSAPPQSYYQFISSAKLLSFRLIR